MKVCPEDAIRVDIPKKEWKIKHKKYTKCKRCVKKCPKQCLTLQHYNKDKRNTENQEQKKAIKRKIEKIKNKRKSYMREILDITYKTIDDHELKLDIFLPTTKVNPPTIVWIHGGAWMVGDRKWCGLKDQVDRGYAVVSIDYRLTNVAPFPACILDCKDALAFLRKNQHEYGLNMEQVIIAGDSAGGHLAALMGVSNGHTDWEEAGIDYRVDAIIDFYGPSTIYPITKRYPGETNEVLDALLGVPVKSKKGMMIASTASPITYIDGTEPPFFILHGDQDEVVHIEQSIILHEALLSEGVESRFHVMKDTGHCYDHLEDVKEMLSEFIDSIFEP